MKRVERELGDCDDELDSQSPPARDIGSLQSQLSNMQACVLCHLSVCLSVCLCRHVFVHVSAYVCYFELAGNTQRCHGT